MDHAGTLVSLVFAVAVIVWLFAVAGTMARRRNHSPWPWWLLSIAWSPLVSILILWIFFSVSDDDQPVFEGEQS